MPPTRRGHGDRMSICLLHRPEQPSQPRPSLGTEPRDLVLKLGGRELHPHDWGCNSCGWMSGWMDGWMDGRQDPPQFLGSHFSSIKTITLVKLLLLEQTRERELKPQGLRSRLEAQGISKDTVGSPALKDAHVPGFSWSREAWWDWLESSPTSLSTAILFCFFLSSKI